MDNPQIARIVNRQQLVKVKLREMYLPEALLNSMLPPFEADIEVHRFIYPSMTTVVMPSGIAAPDTELWVEYKNNQEYVLPRQEGGVSVFMPLSDGGKERLLNMTVAAGYVCRCNLPSVAVPDELQLHQDSHHSETVDRPHLLHFTVRPAWRMLRETLEGALDSFLAHSCRPAACGQPQSSPTFNWDIDESLPLTKSDRIALWALRQFAESPNAAPQQALMCWIVYQDIGQCGISLDSYLYNDTKAARTLANALQHLNMQPGTYSSVLVDQMVHQLSKLLGTTPCYLNAEPDVYSDTESEVAEDEEDVDSMSAPAA